jgi:hypothetical protein
MDRRVQRPNHMRTLKKVGFFLLMCGAAHCGNAGSPGEPVSSGSPAAPGAPDAGSHLASLAWDAPHTNSDGSPLTDLDGYRVYYATSTPDKNSAHVDVTSGTSVDVALPASGQYSFAVTAVDLAGNESSFSQNLTLLVP